MDLVSSKIAALPTSQFVLVAIAGSFAILTAVYLLSRGYVAPLITVFLVAFLMYMTSLRAQTSLPPPQQESPSQFDVFRQMEPADQTRVNVWTGILQEDVYANRTGPIGIFVGNDDYAKNAPLYPFNDGTSYDKSISARNCPTNVQCTCIPLPGDPTKTHCGYVQNGAFVACPSDCCTPSCTY
jgi:hypothetical protein